MSTSEENTQNANNAIPTFTPVHGELEMTIIRADGTIEELGVVSEYHRNPIKNWWVNRKRRKEQLRRMKEYGH